MVQVIPFDQSKAETRLGWCLQNVRTGYGLAPRYASAWKNWLATDQHTDAIPTGVDVPVFFSYKTDGHVGVRLSDGRFWSDGSIYISIEAYTRTHTPIYVGWSTSIENVQVIKEDDMQPITKNELFYTYRGLYAQEKTDEELSEDGLLGKDYKYVNEAVKDYANAHGFDYFTYKKNAEKQIAELGKVVDIKDGEIKKLTAQLAVQSGDTQLLNGFGAWLTKLIVRLGLKG